jgi:hypothetical protein
MIRIAITKAAHAAIAKTIAEGRALDELQELQDGRLWIWLPKGVARGLADLRRPGESYSDAIIRIAEDRP